LQGFGIAVELLQTAHQPVNRALIQTAHITPSQSRYQISAITRTLQDLRIEKTQQPQHQHSDNAYARRR
jgi:hypothetical protein